MQALPATLDRARMGRACDLFGRHAFSVSLVLSTTSLLEAYACPKGVEVLDFTHRLSKNPYRRLAETLQWAVDVQAPDGFAATGRALEAILRIRFMHAVIRHQAQLGSSDVAQVR